MGDLGKNGSIVLIRYIYKIKTLGNLEYTFQDYQVLLFITNILATEKI